MIVHTPVLLKEVVEALDPRPGQTFIDATVNGGGHAAAILERVGSAGTVLGIDWDSALIEKLKTQAQRSNSKNLILECGSYVDIRTIARKHSVDAPRGILFDLGFSSYHIEASGRGFSFLKDEPLDMRYNIYENPITAEKIVNEWAAEAIEDAIRKFGEERFARDIARRIRDARHDGRITRTGQLVSIVERAVPKRYRVGRIHPATRTFQALRIAVNDEFRNIGRGLEEAVNLLQSGGTCAAISFHSLEDRIVKLFFRKKAEDGVICIKVKKPITASPDERRSNPRARSAKLRVIQKI